MEHMIDAAELCHKYGEKEVLRHISIQIAKGEIFGLLGPSGAGKTTLMKILTGQMKGFQGEAFLFGKDVRNLSCTDYNRIGIMMEAFGLYGRLSCYDNLKLFAKIYGSPKGMIEKTLENVGLLDAKRTAAMDLSKGMKNRLLLARALMRNPSVLFLDEPTSGLDPSAAEEIHQLIFAEREKGTTVFLTTHNMAEAEKLCSHTALLYNGKIVEYGSPKEICRRYNHQKKIILHLYNGREVEMPHDRQAAEELSRYLKQDEVETIHSTEPSLETVGK